MLGGMGRKLVCALCALIGSGVLAGSTSAAVTVTPLRGCASAGFSTGLAFLPKGVHVLWARAIPVCTTGSITVAFHGDSAARCAAVGLCPYAGTDVWQPGDGDLTVVAFERHGHRSYEASLDWDGNGPLISDVTRGSAGQCHDTVPVNGAGLPSLGHGTSYTANLGSANDIQFPTRCAGPLNADFQGAAPRATFPLAKLRTGKVAFDLAGTRSFVGHGLAGTVTSTITLRTGRPDRLGGLTGPHKSLHERFVGVEYHLIGESGALRASWTAENPATCARVDGCGSSGVIRLVPRPRHGTFELATGGSSKHSYRYYLKRLGLLHGRAGKPAPLVAAAFLSGGGQVDGSFIQAGNRCADTTSLTESSVLMVGVDGVLAGGYSPTTADYDPLRSRCPGPDLGGSGLAALGLIHLSVDRRRHFTLALRGPVSFTDHGYRVSIESTLVLRFARRRLFERTL
jgi:hypothetical protein